MNSKKTKATTDTMFREAVAKQLQTMGARPEGVTMAVEHGTPLSREALRAEVSRLCAERDPLVLRARAVRLEKGVGSPEFAAAWFDVERVQRDLEEARAALGKAGEAEKVWRDPAVEMPPGEQSVLIRTGNEEEPLMPGYHSNDGWWLAEGKYIRPVMNLLGWMHFHEAAAILDHATRSAARGEVANG